ncbi:phospholipase A1-like [Plodia interpunctella]|uniref:phospholipase A1-like n=1 Tax=Plodia interpunctella TaxID=58824 RepID=UPI0023689764|nr:phospholipase A1-like [Plodia interpunctella]XP_053611599.1 phospholipase A1-like [Plodia interpunctella]
MVGGSFNLGPNPLIINAYLESMDVNAIAVDWSQGARNIDYFQSVAKVPDVGKRIANLIKFLNQETGASFDNMHLIGHSLGAHVVGNAGREVENITGAKVARVTGLDPAGPLWSDNPNKIAKTDAKYVEAIHTNGGPFGLGTLKEWGAANFYPNGGVNQPGCNYPPCSHSRSYELFAATVKHNNLIGRKCPDIEAMLLHSCNGEVAPLGNSDLTKSENGVYRVDTGSKEPFNLEKDL